MTVLKPSANLFALLDNNDPGDDAVLGANAADAAASAPVNINKKQQPEPSIWKLKAIAANTAKKTKKKPQPAASKAKPFSSAPAAARKPQQPAASKAYMAVAANKQQPAAPANLTGELFGRAYPSARYLIYQNHKPREGAENAKDGGAPADDKKGGQDGTKQKDGGRANGAAVKIAPAPAPVKEEPAAPVKPPVPPPPPPKLEDLKQFPGLK